MTNLICRIELHKKNGITIKVDNQDGKIVQTIVLDGTLITLTCAGDSDTSKLTMATDSIHLKCKEFLLESETTTCKSTKETAHSSDTTFSIESKDKLSVKTQADMSTDVSKTATLKADTLSCTATKEATVKGSQSVTISGGQISVKADSEATLSGATANVKADTTLSLKGGITTLEGDSTTIKGSILSIN